MAGGRATGDDGDWGHAADLEDVSGRIGVVGVGESDHSKASGRTATECALSAIERALEDAGLEPGQIDGIMFLRHGEHVDAAAFHAHFGTSHDIWESGEGGGMRWAATAPHAAARAIAAGRAKYVVNSFAVAWATQRGEMTGGPGQSHAHEHFKQNAEVPFGWFPQPVYFATIARRHMHEFGTTQEQLGEIAVALRYNANHTAGAVMRDRPLGLEEYLASPPIADPFRKEDCCLISDGGGAQIFAPLERAADHPKPVVEVAGVGLGRSHAGAYWSQQGAFTSTPQVFAAPAGFAMAGIGPDDVDVLTAYDPFTIVSLMQIEDMGFCEKGAGGEFVSGGHLRFDGGGLPYNTHGGLLSHAYVLGIAHVVELVRQLRGEAEGHQVKDARVGVYGGYTGSEASTLVLRRR
ncbi:MAG: thiolase family protein [Myxococcales bacterium]|nr:thiolase family protein [Myxococcales bacterium]